MSSLGEARIAIDDEYDVVSARRHADRLATDAGFHGAGLTLIVTAISELAHNIVKHAGRGDIHLRCVSRNGRQGIVIVARDEGPGIADLQLALTDGYSTGRGLGLGLTGARRLMDDFEITSTLGEGTTVRATKWTS